MAKSKKTRRANRSKSAANASRNNSAQRRHLPGGVGRELELPHHVQIATRVLGADALHSPEVVPSKLVTVTFTKQDGSPDDLTMTIDGADVLLPTQTSATISRPSGTFANLFIIVRGNGGQTARITVDKALPKLIEISIPPGRNGNAGTKPILVTG